jgi:hypothetical protein
MGFMEVRIAKFKNQHSRCFDLDFEPLGCNNIPYTISPF